MKGLLIGILLLTAISGYGQLPQISREAGSKYIYIPAEDYDNDFKSVAQLRIGSYLTLGNYASNNESWIGSNAILDYGSYGSVGSMGDGNYFVPTYSNGTALVVDFSFNGGNMYGYTHNWNGSSAPVKRDDFQLSWKLGRHSNFLKAGLAIATASTGNNKLAVGGNVLVEGKIRAQELSLKTDVWADFVFDKNYDLPELSKVKEFIDTNQHLPGIPSAQEVKENGVSVGEMNKLLLQKIEELTLYAIDKENEVQELRSKVVKQETESKAMKQRLAKIEALLSQE